MRNTLLVFVTLSAVSWGVWLMWLGWADLSAQRRHRNMIEVRRWKETVQAMRRIADEEGDA